MTRSKCVTIFRDKKWFEEKLPEFQKIWNYVLFLRKNKDKLQLLVNFIESLKTKFNKEIMIVISKLCDSEDPNYDNFIESLNKIIKNNKEKALKRLEELNDNYMFIDENKPIVNKSYVKKYKTPYINNIQKKNDNYMFIDS